MTTKQLTSLCTLWQKRLRLQDWNIEVGFEDEFDSETQLGESTCTQPWQDADISIREGMSKAQTELTLVHELLHIRFAGIQFDPSNVQYLLMEQGIEALARVLVGAKW